MVCTFHIADYNFKKKSRKHRLYLDRVQKDFKLWNTLLSFTNLFVFLIHTSFSLPCLYGQLKQINLKP